MKLIEKHISTNTDAPIVVLFGGSQVRRQEVIYLILEVADLTIFGTLSEEEGIDTLENLGKVDLVLIGGRYTENQRLRIRNFALTKFPNVKFTEPGWDYEYENNTIKLDIRAKLNL